ncbi:MAG: IPTL-CTERM sorting domain-containing protein [Lysobacterales bacterium]
MPNINSFRIATVAALLFFFSMSFTAQAQILVAVEDGSSSGTGADIVSQLNDDTWVDFSATLVTADDIDTIGELNNYQVVILGDSGNRNHDWTIAMSTALRDWVLAGGSAVLTGWGNYGMDQSNAIYDPLDEIFPTQNIASTNQFDNANTVMSILQPGHPIFTGLSDFSFGAGCCTESNPLPLESNDVELATIAGSTVVAIKAAGSGTTVYLGPVYMGNTGYYVAGLRSGDPDRLLEQGVAWAADGVVPIDASDSAPIPTMSQWALIVLSMLLGLMAFANRKRLFQ